MTPLATITPSANWVVEATTIAILRDVPGVVPVFSRTPVPDGRPDDYDLPNMLRAAELLSHAKPAAICWNGSKGGVIGLGHDRALCAAITEATGSAADTSSLMLERLLAARGPTRLGLITPYDDAYTARLLAAFGRQGWDVAAESHLGLSDNLSYASVPGETIRAQAREVAARCDVILAWCTNYPAGFEAAAIEAETGNPCWDATVLGVLAMLRAAGRDLPPGWGTY
jgi:maleate isomerase